VIREQMGVRSFRALTKGRTRNSCLTGERASAVPAILGHVEFPDRGCAGKGWKRRSGGHASLRSRSFAARKRRGDHRETEHA